MVKEGFFGVGLGGSAREIPNEVKREDVGGFIEASPDREIEQRSS